MQAADIYLENDTCFVSGDLHFTNVMSVGAKSFPLLTQLKNPIIDLSKLNACDSSGIALMIEWLNFARKQQKKVTFSAVPAHVLSVLKAARLEKLFE